MRFHRLCLSVLALAAAASLSAAPAVPGRRPNVVLIMADDLGYECVTANGGESYRTPHLDQLAATGMRYTQCHVQPLCTPTRVQLMTGLYNVRNYVEFGSMDPKAITFAHRLKEAGYITGVGGKWQLGDARDSPQHFGFDDALLWHHMRRVSRYPSPGFERNGVPEDHPGKYGPDIVNAFALDFITRNRDRPFFLYYPMLLTHPPFQPTPESAGWDPKAGERGSQDVKYFADMTAHMDRMVGQVVAKLAELGLRENTLVIFLGDNGTPGDVTSRFRGKDYPGGKGSPTARGTHVPLIVNWPGHVSAGTSDDLIASVDFLPTICEAAGVALPASMPPDGRSFLPRLLGQKAGPRDWAYFWYAPDGGAVAKHEFAMTTAYKLYRDGTFFDLRTDQFEERPLRMESLAGEAASVAKTLKEAMAQYAHSRPVHLLQPIVTTKQKKKAEKQKKKQP